MVKKTPVAAGVRFGRLVVIRMLPRTRNEHGHVQWACRCDCGRPLKVWGYSLVKQKNPTRSCGLGACWHFVRATKGPLPTAGELLLDTSDF